MTNVSMFSMHSALALELVAALAASFLLVFAVRRGCEGRKLGTILGSIGLAAAVLSISCTAYYGIAYWNEGIFSPAAVKSQNSMMQNMSSMLSQMQEMMSMGRGGGMAPGGAPSGADGENSR